MYLEEQNIMFFSYFYCRYQCFYQCIVHSPREETLDQSDQQTAAFVCLQSLLALHGDTGSRCSPETYGLLIWEATSVGSSVALQILLQHCVHPVDSLVMRGAHVRALQVAAQKGFLEAVSQTWLLQTLSVPDFGITHDAT